jgi:hypothetical protein
MQQEKRNRISRAARQNEQMMELKRTPSKQARFDEEEKQFNDFMAL